jgi:hypothetical protein
MPIDAPIKGFCIPAETPTVQRSCDMAEIPGADADGTVRVSPVNELLLVVAFVVVLEDEPL